MCYVWIAAAAMSAVSAYSAAKTRKETADYQSKVAANNQQVAEYQAEDAKQRGDTAAQDVRRRYAALLGTQRASLAARGLDISDGSANATLQDTAYFGALDEATTRANAAREAWGYRVRAQNAGNDAAFYKASADAENPLLSAGLAGGGTLFSGGSGSVASRWYAQAGDSSTNWSGWGGTAQDQWYG